MEYEDNAREMAEQLAQAAENALKKSVEYVINSNNWMLNHPDNMFEKIGVTDLTQALMDIATDAVKRAREDLYQAIQVGDEALVEQAGEHLLAQQNKVDELLNDPNFCKQQDAEVEILNWDEIISSSKDRDVIAVAADMQDYEDSLIETKKYEIAELNNVQDAIRDTVDLSYVGQKNIAGLIESIEQYENSYSNLDNVVKIDAAKESVEGVDQLSALSKEDLIEQIISLREDLAHQESLLQAAEKSYVNASGKVLDLCNSNDKNPIMTALKEEIMQNARDTAKEIGNNLKSAWTTSADLFNQMANSVKSINKEMGFKAAVIMDKLTLGAYSKFILPNRERRSLEVKAAKNDTLLIDAKTNMPKVPEPNIIDKLSSINYKLHGAPLADEVAKAAWDKDSPIEKAMNGFSNAVTEAKKKMNTLHERASNAFAMVKADVLNVLSKKEMAMAALYTFEAQCYKNIDKTMQEQKQEYQAVVDRLSGKEPRQKREYTPSKEYQEVMDKLSDQAKRAELTLADIARCNDTIKKELKKAKNFDNIETVKNMVDKVITNTIDKARIAYNQAMIEGFENKGKEYGEKIQAAEERAKEHEDKASDINAKNFEIVEDNDMEQDGFDLD